MVENVFIMYISTIFYLLTKVLCEKYNNNLLNWFIPNVTSN